MCELTLSAGTYLLFSERKKHSTRPRYECTYVFTRSVCFLCYIN